MKIKANGKEVQLKENVNVKELLDIQKVEMPEYVTVQINDDIIPKEQFETAFLKDGDVVEFLYFMGGGSI
ncbi:sulfur carrier protein ThiS [Herbivorax sp. ANBcel31]|uniref:sulfur carrier protein ThiS n=1 Tax=Herbivorax sp. ANBcel31 TaxID=3069754 RepID=UPI0027B837C5|nr:sulfur carrier protein ThiS [Herbivorax sp. ANBcel31]MDQ2085444.1 sulfur carrier protein ThiS [Herbivorax sp. ANBcel31]